MSAWYCGEGDRKKDREKEDIVKKEIGRRIERRGYCEERARKKDREKEDRKKRDIVKIWRRIERKKREERENKLKKKK